ncbi:MAG TPA: DNA topoisomerase IB [Candidatus Eisenbacteria bacterium]|nr:DNA topoisomerase IB [Candidatus Eisenbacteria bacterium]
MTIIERLQARGIRRLGSKERGFRYRTASGSRVTAEDRERIDALKVPPAWRDVAIHPSPGALVQAVGRDKAGRWQYRYHAKQVLRRNRAKRERLLRFIAALPRMRRAVTRDLALRGLKREKVLAGVLRILSTCFLRPGSEEYASQNGSYGIATLKPRHVSVRGDLIRFDFEGKSGRRQVRELRDRRLAPLVRALLRHPGEVFKFESDGGAMVDVRREHINAYIMQVMGERFSAKDFRTWAGTLLCACALARDGVGNPSSRTEAKRRVVAAVREVSEHLGNTPAVCRASYVFPEVIRRFELGRVLENRIEGVDELVNGSPRALERCERALLDLLTSASRPQLRGARRARPLPSLRLEVAREPIRPADHPEPRSVALPG